MKTTELFVDHVLIGLLVIATVTALSPLHITSFTGLDLEIAAFLAASAYFVGILYDRFADTLLQDQESHQHLIHAIMRGKDKKLLHAKNRKDIFNVGKYRMVVIRNSEASDYADFLRSRIRLTRALTTLLPAMSVALIAFLSKTYTKTSEIPGVNNPTESWILCALVTAVYAIAFVSQFMKTSISRYAGPHANPDVAALAWCSWIMPPKTKLSADEMTAYKALIHYSDRDKFAFRFQFRAIFVVDPVLCLSALFLVGLGVSLAIHQNNVFLTAIPLIGLLLNVLAGWTWSRILNTFLSFIRRFANSEPKPLKVSASPA